jgi:hypothetical protein
MNFDEHHTALPAMSTEWRTAAKAVSAKHR